METGMWSPRANAWYKNFLIDLKVTIPKEHYDRCISEDDEIGCFSQDSNEFSQGTKQSGIDERGDTRDGIYQVEDQQPSKTDTNKWNGEEPETCFLAYNLRKEIEQTKLRKSWGCFTNIFNEKGRQKQCMYRRELANYFPLFNRTHPESPFRYYVSLFAGKYPKPLAKGSILSWRLRYNIYASGPFGGSSEEDSQPSSECATDVAVIHLGEIHIYLNIERHHHQPLYTNLCFFFDPYLLEDINVKMDHAAMLDDFKIFTANPREEDIRYQVKQCAMIFKQELCNPKFTEQLYLPIDHSRFESINESVEDFKLRQENLQLAIEIVNGKFEDKGNKKDHSLQDVKLSGDEIKETSFLSCRCPQTDDGSQNGENWINNIDYTKHKLVLCNLMFTIKCNRSCRPAPLKDTVWLDFNRILVETLQIVAGSSVDYEL